MNAKVMKTLRHFVYAGHRTAAALAVCKNVPYSHDKCVDILKAAGYPFRPLWSDFTPPLPPLDNTLTISIVIPVYNVKTYVAKCLDTILSQQTQYSYEVICVNDGSTDGSELIVQEKFRQYPQVRTTYLSQKNQGISAARNTGIAASHGRYIGFIDSDDYVTNDFIECIVKYAIETDADIVQTGWFTQYIHSNIITSTQIEDFILDETNKPLWIGKVRGFPWGGCYKREIFNEIRYPYGFWYEDMITRSILIRQCKKIAILAKPLYYRCFNDTNITTFMSRRINDIRVTDQYWLAKLSMDYILNKQGQTADDYVWQVLLQEYSYLLAGRQKNLGKEQRKACFYLARECAKEVGLERFAPKEKLMRSIQKALLDGNYARWKNLSFAYSHWKELRKQRAKRAAS